ncbi:MAG: hypothetical protein P8R54_22505 [Myxococcota bacterium]|nr:hypothetical protein [Myxococcota bacterium]
MRRASGDRYTFSSLSRLRIALYNQTVTGDDELSFNRDIWRRISEIPDLRSYFWMIWQRAQRGGLPGRHLTLVGDSASSDDEFDDFDEELPTRIIGAPAPVALEMQVTIPCFTDEVPRPRSARSLLASGGALSSGGAAPEGAPARAVGALVIQPTASASQRPRLIPPAPSAPQAGPLGSAPVVVSQLLSSMSRKVELLVLTAGALTAAVVVGLLSVIGLV